MVPESLTQPPSPVYRRLLAGGADDLRLRRADVFAVAGFGAAVLAAAWAGSPAAQTGAASRTVAVLATLATAVLVAVLAARWLGRRVGLLAGIVYASTAGALLQARSGDASDALLALGMAAAMGAFGLGNTAGRLPMRTERWVARVFYAAAGATAILAGPVGPLYVLAACLLVLYLGEDPQGLRFFAEPVGLGIFAALAAAAPAGEWLAGAAGTAGWHGVGGIALWGACAGPSPAETTIAGLVRQVAGLMLPWTPLVALAAVAGLARAHGALPVCRLFGSWAAAPLALTAAGLCGVRPPVALVLPPLAVMAAAGANDLAAWARRGARRRAVAAAIWTAFCVAVAGAAPWREGPVLPDAVLACAAAAVVGMAALARRPKRDRPAVKRAGAAPAFYVVRTADPQRPAPAASARSSSTA